MHCAKYSNAAFGEKLAFSVSLQRFFEPMFLRLKNLFFTSVFSGFALFGIVWFSVSSKPVETAAERRANLAEENQFILKDTFRFVDEARGREIPYVLYRPEKVDSAKPIQLVVFSHGYGKNYSKNYLGYTYITKFLAKKGFWVLSIQHELPGDPPLAFGDSIYAKRLPVWTRGMESIRTTIRHFKANYPNLKIESVDLVGHSNGGDMSVLSAITFPNEFRKIVTLDNLRCPFPLQLNPKVMSLRSSDKTPDDGVIPDARICDSLGIEIVQLKKVKHNDMTDYASRTQKKQIIAPIYRFLKD